MPNQTLKDRIRKNGLKLWEVAYFLGMTDGNFSRLLRVELTDAKRQKVEAAIDELLREKSEG